MSRMKLTIGGKKAVAAKRHCVEVAEDTVIITDITRNGVIVPAFSFSTADGHGTSPEIVPFDELEEYYEVLVNAQSEGIRKKEDEAAEAVYVPTYEVLKQQLCRGTYRTPQRDAQKRVVKIGKEIQFDDHGERIFLKSRATRGSKNQKIMPNQFDDFVEFVGALRDEVETSQAAFESALPELLAEREAERVKEAEEAAAAAEKQNS